MNTENLSTLKIHKLTQAQYDRELAAGRIDPNALYLTPDEEVDLSPYATVEQLNEKADAEHGHDNYVPVTRKINNKVLSADITLSALDVGALPSSTVIPTVPTKVSAFTNDAGYLTEHQSLDDYALKSEIPSVEGLITKEYVDETIKTLAENGQIGSDNNKVYTFDGNTEGLLVVPYEETISYVKISDETPDLHNWISFTMATDFIGEYYEQKLVNGSIDENYNIIILDVKDGDDTLLGAKGTIIAGEFPVVIVITDISNSPIPSTGLYVAWGYGTGVASKIGTWTSEIVIGGEVSTINPKYLPEGGFGYTSERTTILEEQEVTIALVDGTNDILGNIPGEFNISGEELTIVWDGVEYVSNLLESGGGQYAYMIADGVALAYNSNPDKLGLTFISGTSGIGTHTIAIYKGSETIHRIDPKYLPEGGFGYTEDVDKVIVLEETTIQTAVDGGDFIGYVSGIFPISSNEELIVVWEGAEYKVKTYPHPTIEGALMFGKYGGETPFIGCYYSKNPNIGFVANNIGTFTVSIYKTGKEVVHGIDPKYLPEGGFGYTKENIYTYDGNPTGKVTAEIFPMEYVKISNDTPDLNNIVKGGGYLFGDYIELSKNELVIEVKATDFGQAVILSGDDAMVILSVTNPTDGIPETGLYVYGYGEDYISYVEFAGTICRIDPKFLPQGGFGYTEGTITTIVEEQEVEIVKVQADPTDGISYEAGVVLTTPISKGDELTFVWDGIEYEVKAYLVEELNPDYNLPGVITLINESVALPVMILHSSESLACGIFGSSDMVGAHTIAIYKGSKEVIHKIDSKYIPDGFATEEYVGEQIKALEDEGKIGGVLYESATLSSKEEDMPFPTEIRSLVGMTVTYELPGDGFYFMRDPKTNRDVDYQIKVNIENKSVYFVNTTVDGMLNKRAFVIDGTVNYVCPTFSLNYPDTNAIMYLYETTSDTMGLGLTVSKGWYAVNSQTYAFTPFNIEDNPIVLKNFDGVIDNGYSDMDFVDFIIDNWFELEKVRTFTVAEKNIGKASSNSDADFVMIADFSNEGSYSAPDDEVIVHLSALYCFNFVFAANRNADGVYESFSIMSPLATEKVTISWPAGIKPIDTKWLPEALQFGNFRSVYTYDGDPNKIISLEAFNASVVKVSNVVHDIGTLTFAKAHTLNHGIIELSKLSLIEEYSIKAVYGSCPISDESNVASVGGIVCFAINEQMVEFTGLTCGTYFYVDLDNGWYPTYVEFNELKTIDPKYLPEGGFGYTENNKITILEEQDITTKDHGAPEGIYGGIIGTCDISEGDKVLVVWDGTEYECVVFAGSNESLWMGNPNAQTGSAGSGDPFLIGYQTFGSYSGFMIYVTGDNQNNIISTHKVAIYKGNDIIHRINPIYLPEGGVGWTESDPGYILPEITFTFDSSSDSEYMFDSDIELEEGRKYLVTWNGVDYECECISFNENGYDMYVLGNIGMVLGFGNTREPFVIACAKGTCIIVPIIGSGEYTVKIKALDMIHKIDDKYIPILTKGVTTITYDGNGIRFGGDDQVTVVKILNDPIDLSTVDNIVLGDPSTGHIHSTYTKNDLKIVEAAGAKFLTTTTGAVPFIISIDDVIDEYGIMYGIGTFILDDEDDKRLAVCSFDCEKTVIDSNYFPEGGVGYSKAKEIIVEEQEVIIEQTSEGNSDWAPSYGGTALATGSLSNNDRVNIVLDGIEYECRAYLYDFLYPNNSLFAGIGLYLFGGLDSYEDNELPVAISYCSSIGTVSIDGSSEDVGSSHTISIYKPEVIHKIDPKYLPEMNISILESLATEAYVDGTINALAENGQIGKEIKKEEPLLIEWDGNIEGRASTVLSYTTNMYKVSDYVPTAEALAVLKAGFEYRYAEYTDWEEIKLLDQGAVYIDDDWNLAFVLEDGALFEDCVFPEAGVYFTYFGAQDFISGVRCNDIIIDKTELYKIDFKYLPDTVPTKEYIEIRVPAWTEADEGKVLRIVNGTPTWVALPNAEEASF